MTPKEILKKYCLDIKLGKKSIMLLLVRQLEKQVELA